MLRLLLACNWMLLLTILTSADTGDGASGGTLGAVGMLKVVTRVAALGILAWIVFSSWSDRRRGPILRMMLPWFLFAAWAVVSTAWSPLWKFSLGQSSTLVMLLLLAYSTAMVAWRFTHMSHVLYYVCWGLLLLSATMVVGSVVAPNAFDIGRGASGGFHPTNVSATAALALVVIVSVRLVFAWPWSRWLVWPSLVVHCGALYLAHNRASIVVTFFVLGGFVLLKTSPAWRWLLLTAGSMACAAYLTFDPGFMLVDQTSGALANYMARDQSVQQLSEFSGRGEMWSAIWDSFLRAPWLGHGYFVSSETGQIYVWYEWTNWTAHNFWLQVLVGTGIVGGILLAFALVCYVLRLVLACHDGAGLKRLISIAAAVLIWQTGWGLTNESFVGPLQAESIVFFLVLGLVTGRMVVGQLQQEEGVTSAHFVGLRRHLLPASEPWFST